MLRIVEHVDDGAGRAAFGTLGHGCFVKAGFGPRPWGWCRTLAAIEGAWLLLEIGGVGVMASPKYLDPLGLSGRLFTI